MSTLKYTTDHPAPGTSLQATTIIRQAPELNSSDAQDIAERYLASQNNRLEDITVTVLDQFHYLMDTSIDEHGIQVIDDKKQPIKESRVYLSGNTLQIETRRGYIQLSVTTKGYVLAILSSEK